MITLFMTDFHRTSQESLISLRAKVKEVTKLHHSKVTKLHPTTELAGFGNTLD